MLTFKEKSRQRNCWKQDKFRNIHIIKIQPAVDIPINSLFFPPLVLIYCKLLISNKTCKCPKDRMIYDTSIPLSKNLSQSIDPMKPTWAEPSLRTARNSVHQKFKANLSFLQLISPSRSASISSDTKSLIRFCFRQRMHKKLVHFNTS